MHLYWAVYLACLTPARVLEAMRLLMRALLPLFFAFPALGFMSADWLRRRVREGSAARIPGSYLGVLLSVKKRE